MKTKMISWITALVMLLAFMAITPALVRAEGVTVKLPDGQEIPVGNLSNQERYDLMKLLNKVSGDRKITEAAATRKAVEIASNPEKLDAWRKVITGTIKDVCNDLNVTVNEFIKTPVGMGTAALIIYKVAGKDVLSKAVSVIIMIPFWLFSIVVILYLRHRYFGSSVVYHRKTEIGTGKFGKAIYEYSEPEREINYPWRSEDAKIVLAVTLSAAVALVTIEMLVNIM